MPEKLKFGALVQIHSRLLLLEDQTLSGLNDQVDALVKITEEGYPTYPWKGRIRFFNFREPSLKQQRYIQKRRSDDSEKTLPEIIKENG